MDAGKWLAGGALTIAALGSRFKQTFGRLRVAIDAVLDIDNYFADPPSNQPPRARIFSRYASLLAYLRDKGYARIVIVSHSQGTVISADLLRYLHVQGRFEGITGGVPVSLVTVGSPLRDLYAERFPLLYRWMGSNAGGFATAAPSAADIGAVEWVNAPRSGDRRRNPPDFLGGPLPRERRSRHQVFPHRQPADQDRLVANVRIRREATAMAWASSPAIGMPTRPGSSCADPMRAAPMALKARTRRAPGSNSADASPAPFFRAPSAISPSRPGIGLHVSITTLPLIRSPRSFPTSGRAR